MNQPGDSPILLADTECDVVSALYRAGATEDGEDYIAECFFVTAVTSDRRRFDHPSSFPGCVVHCDDEDGMISFEDVRDKARADAQALCDKLKSDDRANIASWIEQESFATHMNFA